MVFAQHQQETNTMSTAADIESILKLVDKHYREKMNQMKTERKGKARYTDKINTHAPSRWCVHNTFAYGEVLDPLKVHHGKNCRKVCRAH